MSAFTLRSSGSQRHLVLSMDSNRPEQYAAHTLQGRSVGEARKQNPVGLIGRLHREGEKDRFESSHFLCAISISRDLVPSFYNLQGPTYLPWTYLPTHLTAILPCLLHFPDLLGDWTAHNLPQLRTPSTAVNSHIKVFSSRDRLPESKPKTLHATKVFLSFETLTCLRTYNTILYIMHIAY